MRRLAAGLLLAAAVPAELGAASREVEVALEDFAYRTAETPLNRANLLGLDRHEHLLRAGVNWRETRGAARAVLRGYVQRRLGSGGERTEWTARQAYVQYAFGETLSVRAGKQRVAWGSGFAWNPTNRLEPPRNPLNTGLEQEGAEAVRFDFLPASWAAVTVVAARNDTGLRDLPFETPRPRRRTGAVRARFLAADTDLALVVSGGKGQRTLWGLDVARDLGGGIAAHVEAAVYRGAEVAPARDGEAFVRVSAGALRTFGADQTVAVEYFFNGEGDADAEHEAYLGALETAFGRGALADYALLAARPYAGGMGLRRHYLHASWTRAQAGGRWTFAVRAVAGLSDGGFAVTPGIGFSPRGEVTFQVDAVALGGPGDSEYRLAPLRGGLQARLRYLF